MGVINKVLVLVSAIILSTQLLAQEIPNPGFENWGIPNTWTYTPDDWTTQNTQIIENAVMDSMPNSGNFALKIHPISEGVIEYGYAETTFPTTFIPTELQFAAKWEKTSTAGVGVEVIFYNGSASIGSAFWGPDIDTSAWTMVSLPIEIIYNEVTHAEIRVSVSVGDFAPGDGWISVDDFSFEIVDGVVDEEVHYLTLEPNPCSDYLNIDVDHLNKENSNITVLDVSGRVVFVGDYIERLNTTLFNSGQYFLIIQHGVKKIGQKFIVQH